jgi:hypothetical protein
MRRPQLSQPALSIEKPIPAHSDWLFHYQYPIKSEGKINLQLQ